MFEGMEDGCALAAALGDALGLNESCCEGVVDGPESSENETVKSKSTTGG